MGTGTEGSSYADAMALSSKHQTPATQCTACALSVSEGVSLRTWLVACKAQQPSEHEAWQVRMIMMSSVLTATVLLPDI